MSMECCSKCGRPFDTDFEGEYDENEKPICKHCSKDD